MADHIAVVTNATEYAGLPCALALAQAGFSVVCHGRGFDEESARQEFTTAHRELRALVESKTQPH